MDSAQQRVDPLLAACAKEAHDNPRFGEDAEALVAWSTPLFPKEPPRWLRLRRAAALLGDIAWQDHPDYRADQAMRHALYMPVGGLDHVDRAFLAAALSARYGGNASPDFVPPLRLLDAETRDTARAAGLALRLAYTLTGGVPGLLEGSALKLTEGKLTLSLVSDHSLLAGEAVQRRLDAVARVLGKTSELRRT
jgi:exopolyphosphatase/guanosine-5'-triphosphate,3'-diphosphate pyrophosphatase